MKFDRIDIAVLIGSVVFINICGCNREYKLEHTFRQGDYVRVGTKYGVVTKTNGYFDVYVQIEDPDTPHVQAYGYWDLTHARRGETTITAPIKESFSIPLEEERKNEYVVVEKEFRMRDLGAVKELGAPPKEKIESGIARGLSK